MEKMNKFIGKIALALVFLATGSGLAMDIKMRKDPNLVPDDFDMRKENRKRNNSGNGQFEYGPWAGYPPMGDSAYYMQGKSFKDRAVLSVQKGVYDGISSTVKECLGEVLKFAPWAIRSFTGSCENMFYRFFTQIKPLSEERLIIINNKLTKLISPYTQVSLGNFSKEKRAEIDTNVSVSNSWNPIKNRIVLELDNTINFFNTSLIWFSPQLANIKSGRIQRLAIKFSNSFSGTDHESLKIQIGYTISDLLQLREIVASTKSLKEVQEKHSELKTWLAIVCQDLKYAGQLINYGSDNGKSKDGKFMEPSASNGSSGSSKSSGLSLSDMDLSSLAGLN